MGQNISSVVEDWIVHELDEICDKERRTRSAVIEMLLIEALKAKKGG